VLTCGLLGSVANCIYGGGCVTTGVGMLGVLPNFSVEFNITIYFCVYRRMYDDEELAKS
jgi:IS1 family transposase